MNDDYAFNKHFDEIFELLKNNESETIDILMTLSEKDIEWLTLMFEYLSAKFQSRRFILSLEGIQKISPKLSFTNK